MRPAVFVFGSESYASGISLDFIGATGCFAYTNANIHTLIGSPASPGNTTTFGCPCRSDEPSARFFTVYAQAASPRARRRLLDVERPQGDRRLLKAACWSRGAGSARREQKGR